MDSLEKNHIVESEKLRNEELFVWPVDITYLTSRWICSRLRESASLSRESGIRFSQEKIKKFDGYSCGDKKCSGGGTPRVLARSRSSKRRSWRFERIT